MGFTVINEPFTCEACDTAVPAHPAGSCRNHCPQCLSSKHLDGDTPGDRASNCHALMPAIGVTQSGKKGFMLLHHCQKCGLKRLNTVAPDDNMDRIIALSQHPLEESP